MTGSAETDLTTREKILAATVKLLYGAQHREITTRRIAREAQVNIAAINYHFRSKDELVDEAVRTATAAAFQAGMKILRAPGEPAGERLRSFLSGYAMGLVKFPGLTRNAWLGFFQKEGGETFYGRFMKEMLQAIAGVIGEIPGAAGPEDRGAAALMLVSCVIFPFLGSRTIRDAGALDYEDDAARTRYIDTALALLAGSRQAGLEKEENENG